jgi:hypothetical protein
VSTASPPWYQAVLIRDALERFGIEFTSGDEPGVKLKRTGPQGGMRVSELNAENDG